MNNVVSGFIPRLNSQFGQRYTVAATEGLSEFQRSQLNSRAARNQLERVVDLQAGKGQPWDLVDRFVSPCCQCKIGVELEWMGEERLESQEIKLLYVKMME